MQTLCLRITILWALSTFPYPCNTVRDEAARPRAPVMHPQQRGRAGTLTVPDCTAVPVPWVRPTSSLYWPEVVVSHFLSECLHFASVKMPSLSFSSDAIKYARLLKASLSCPCLIGPFAKIFLGGGFGVGVEDLHSREMCAFG